MSLDSVEVTVAPEQTIEVVSTASGPPGPPGQSTTVLQYQFKTATGTPPGSGEVRANNIDQTLATALYLHPVTAEGNDATNVINALAAGDKVAIEDVADATKVQRYQLGSVTLAGGYFTLAVTWLSGGVPLTNQTGNARAGVLFFYPGPVGPQGPTGPQGPAGPVRQQVVVDAAGMISWSYDPAAARAGLALTGGALRSRMLGLFAGDTVTSLVVLCWVAAAGTAPTSLKLGLYRADASTATLVAQTGELAADSSWTSIGYKPFALTSSYVVPATGAYYVAALMVGTFGTTQPQLALGLGSAVAQSIVGSGLPLALYVGGQSSFPSTISYPNRDGQLLWVAATGTAA